MHPLSLVYIIIAIVVVPLATYLFAWSVGCQKRAGLLVSGAVLAVSCLAVTTRLMLPDYLLSRSVWLIASAICATALIVILSIGVYNKNRKWAVAWFAASAFFFSLWNASSAQTYGGCTRISACHSNLRVIANRTEKYVIDHKKLPTLTHLVEKGILYADLIHCPSGGSYTVKSSPYGKMTKLTISCKTHDIERFVIVPRVSDK